ncbi:hypothetical protein BKA65DRAFT_226144 [Rhexocercosporidium sp. MPI-PUGE-AT-0058]|nr:hypothetical protein BKA65DRAFT_226144 [Rhexocercosporidium sp. MPI-PUGE-AT-0058]
MPSYVIVGASRGLGFAWLRFLSQDPKNIVIGLVRDVEKTNASLAAENITNVHILHGDMVDRKSLEAAATSAADILPNGLDVIIINGVFVTPEAEKLSISELAAQPELLSKDMHTSLDVNLIGSINSINSFLPLIQKGAAKKIVVISTGMADIDLPVSFDITSGVTYAVIKAALNMVVSKYAAELKSQNIKVLALSPGLVATQMNTPSTEDMEFFGKMVASFKKGYPDWRGTPLTPAESVGHMNTVIENLTMADTGSFLSHWGNKAWL